MSTAVERQAYSALVKTRLPLCPDRLLIGGLPMEPAQFNLAKMRRRRFGYVIWGLLCLLISLVGFWPSYVTPLSRGTYQSPSPTMTLHVISTALWLVLLVLQPLLVQFRRLDVHRVLGYFGVLVAVAVVFTGVVVQLDVMGPYAASADVRNAVVIPFIRLTLLLGFAVCVAWAVVLRKRPEWHKRLIILGTFPLLQSAFDRMGANVFNLPDYRGVFAGLGHLGLIIMFLTWDRMASGYFHPVTKWGTILIVLFYMFSPAVAGTDWWRQLAASLAKR
ncbi:hypothetical protein AYO47_02875 [Planctomyces sp. SCGC AG-212-M04]|nr:hypothetical protein AYO47_02875 [Planctomyces sp. SCGC AG-212-M04]